MFLVYENKINSFIQLFSTIYNRTMDFFIARNKILFAFNIFKSRLISRVDHDKVPKYYYYDLRLISILQARLCMTSSSRNEHFYIIFFY